MRARCGRAVSVAAACPPGGAWPSCPAQSAPLLFPSQPAPLLHSHLHHAVVLDAAVVVQLDGRQLGAHLSGRGGRRGRAGTLGGCRCAGPAAFLPQRTPHPRYCGPPACPVAHMLSHPSTPHPAPVPHLLEGDLVHAAVERVQQQLGQVGARAEELGGRERQRGGEGSRSEGRAGQAQARARERSGSCCCVRPPGPRACRVPAPRRQPQPLLSCGQQEQRTCMSLPILIADTQQAMP